MSVQPRIVIHNHLARVNDVSYDPILNKMMDERDALQDKLDAVERRIAKYKQDERSRQSELSAEKRRSGR